MKNILMYLLLGILLFSCGTDPDQNKGGTGDSRFHTTPPSSIYFKNMRSTQYAMQEQPKSRIEIYQHKQFGEEGQRPALYPVIANNWLQDEAYLFLYQDAGVELHEPLTLTTDTSTAETLILEGPQPRQQYQVAMKLYEGLKQEKRWYVKQRQGGFEPLYQEGNQRGAFLITLQDYLKLTESD